MFPSESKDALFVRTSAKSRSTACRWLVERRTSPVQRSVRRDSSDQKSLGESRGDPRHVMEKQIHGLALIYLRYGRLCSVHARGELRNWAADWRFAFHRLSSIINVQRVAMLDVRVIEFWNLTLNPAMRFESSVRVIGCCAGDFRIECNVFRESRPNYARCVITLVNCVKIILCGK